MTATNNGRATAWRKGDVKRHSRNGLAGLAAIAMLAIGTDSAVAANSGSATCVNQAPVVGVWVNVSGGTSGWAARSGSGFAQNWSYNTQGKSYSLTVGCGGTPSAWRWSTSTPSYSTTWSHVMCFPGGSYGYGTAYVYNRCYRA